MPEYIEREAAIRRLSLGVFIGEDPVEFVKKVPAADVEPVRHGKWIHDGNCVHDGTVSLLSDWCHCSECEHRESFDFKTPYCPNCGAKMDLECASK